MSNMNVNYIIGGDSLTVFFEGQPYTINKQAHTYGLVLTAIKNNDVNALRNSLNIRQGIAQALTKGSSASRVRIEQDQIFYDDREVTGLISSRIFEVIRLGLDVKPMIRFLENLMTNPSKRAVDELFGFLEACKLPITDDGHFLAYKRVRADYRDVHSGTMDNSVGQVLEMPRNLVDEDKNRTCSSGLHFCSYEYLSSFGGDRIMVLKINPRDVVAIPTDYNNSKGRTCRYEVVDELPVNDGDRLPQRTIKEDYTDEYSDDCEDSEWDESSDESWDESWDESDEVLEEVEVPAPAVPPAAKVAKAAKVTTSSRADNTTGKLTVADVKQIRRRLAKGDSLAGIGRKFGVSARQVARIRDGEAWSNV